MKKLFSLFAASILMMQAAFAVQPYDSINVLAPTPYYIPNSWMITNALANNNGTVFIDVGSPEGGAARYAASYAPGLTAVYSVDTWSGATSYQQFLSNVHQENTTALIIPLRMESTEAAEALNVEADFIYINTEYADTITDTILKWFPHLKENGILAGDNWNDPQVELAVILASSALGLSVNSAGTYWWVSE